MINEDSSIRPTIKQPVSDLSKGYEKTFKTTMKKIAPNVSLNEVDDLLSEAEISLKKKIFSLSKMEALVFSDPKLSAVYDEMAENGEERFGYHYNETIMNIIFNDYVLNSPKYLQKYKMAIPKKKKRRDKSGINQLKKSGEEIMKREHEPQPVTANETTGAASSGAFSGQLAINNNSIKDNVNETTTAASSGAYVTPAAWGDGDLMKGKKSSVVSKPIWHGGTIIGESNYLTDPSGFNKYIQKLNEDYMDIKNIDNSQKQNIPPDTEEKINREIIDDTSAFTSDVVKNWGKDDTELQYQTDKTGVMDNSNTKLMENTNNMITSKEQLKGMKITEELIPQLADEALYAVAILIANKLLPINFNWNDLPDTNSMWDYIDENGNMTYVELLAAVKEAVNDRLSKDGMNLEDLMGEGVVSNSPETEPKIGQQTFNKGDKVFDKLHNSYGIVLDNYGNPTDGDMGDVRLDSDGNVPIYSSDGNSYNLIKVNNIQEKSTSRAQQQAAGIALSAKRGEIPTSKLSGASKQMAKMGEKDLEDFAKTKHKGLPKYVDEAQEKYIKDKFYNDKGIYKGIVKGQHVFLRHSADPSFKEYGEKYYKEKINEVRAINELLSLHNVVKYVSDIPNEEPFMMGGEKWQYVLGKYPNGKKDIAVYRFGTDLVYEYDKFREAFNLNEDNINEIAGVQPSNQLNNFYQNLDPQKAVEKATVDYIGAMKKNNKSQADKIAGNLKTHLDSKQYDWKKDPYAMEILSDFLQPNTQSIKETDQSVIADNSTGTMALKPQASGTVSSGGIPVGLTDMKESYNLLEELNNELNAYSIHHTKLMKMSEDRKPSALVLKDRLGVENQSNFKKDLQHSGTKETINVEKELMYKDQQTNVGDDPQKLGLDIEKKVLSTNKGEALKNVGDSANDKGDEIPKRNLTQEEQDEVNKYRLGLGDYVYDNEPSERFEERMKKDMGDELYKQRQEKLKFRSKAPMYNKEAQPIENTAVKKVQFDKEKNGWSEREGLEESMITGRYRDALNKSRIIDFQLNEVKKLTKLNEALFVLDFTGLGNSYNSKSIDNRVSINETIINALNTHKFYTDGKQVFVMKNTQKLTENDNKIKPVVNEQVDKMKHLLNYKPELYISTQNTKKSRGF